MPVQRANIVLDIKDKDVFVTTYSIDLEEPTLEEVIRIIVAIADLCYRVENGSIVITKFHSNYDMAELLKDKTLEKLDDKEYVNYIGEMLKERNEDVRKAAEEVLKKWDQLPAESGEQSKDKNSER